MQSLYIETALFAVPNYAVNPESASRIFDKILHIFNILMAHSPIRIVSASRAEEILWGANFGPSYDQIAEFIEMMDLNDVYSARDITILYQTILDHSCRSNLDSSAETAEIFKFSNLQISPPLPPVLSPLSLRVETERAFAAVALMQKIEGQWLLSSPIERGASSFFTVDVNLEQVNYKKIHQIDCSLTISISCNVQIYEKFEDLVDEDMGFKLWKNAKVDDEISFALVVGALCIRKIAGHNLVLDELAPFLVGSDFFGSLVQHQCSNSGRFSQATYQLCVQIVAQTCTRPIGTFGRPRQKIRRCDQAKAWRTHLTSGKEGLRLMYWSSDMGIEFANVGVKHALQISSGSTDIKLGLSLVETLIDIN